MDKLSIALTSRTVWTIVLMFVVNGIAGVHDLIPAGWLPLVDGVLGILAIYFRVSPRATPPPTV